MLHWLGFCLQRLARQQPVILASNIHSPPPLQLPMGPIWACSADDQAGYPIPGRPQTQLQQTARRLLKSGEPTDLLSIPLNPWAGDNSAKHNLQLHLRRLSPSDLPQLMLLDGKLRLGQSCQLSLDNLELTTLRDTDCQLSAQARRVNGQFVLFEPCAAPIAIFGAGALAHQIVNLLSDSAVDVYWEAAASERVQLRQAANIVTREPVGDALDWLPDNSHCLVMTHDHALDFKLCANLAKRDQVSSVGMVGSRRKCERLQQQLAEKQLKPQQTAKIRCPIGSTNTLSLNAAALTIAHELTQLTADTYYSL